MPSTGVMITFIVVLILWIIVSAVEAYMDWRLGTVTKEQTLEMRRERLEDEKEYADEDDQDA